MERKPALGKRSRYYQSQMDMEMLLTGEDHTKLPNTYVIFICDFDPFGKDKYRYTFWTTCQESENVDLEDGRTTVFLNTRGKNESEVPGELVTFLQYMKEGLREEAKRSFTTHMWSSYRSLSATLREAGRWRNAL